jgi:hypothetical protein
MSRIAGNNESSVIVVKLFDYTVAVSTTSGVVAAWTNPFGRSILIHQVIADVTTASTGASTVDIGVGADATTASDNLMDGVSLAATGQLNSQKNAGTNGNGCQKATSANAVTMEVKSGDVNGVAMSVYAMISIL